MCFSSWDRNFSFWDMNFMRRLIRAGSLSGFTELARQYGLDPLQLLSEADIVAQALLEPELKIPTVNFDRLLELAATRAGAMDFGIRLAERRRVSATGLVGLYAREQTSLRSALKVISDYGRLHNEAASLVLEEEGDFAIARLEVLTSGRPLSRQFVELGVGVVCRGLRMAIGPGWRPESVLFRHSAPPDLSAHMRVFGSTPEFRQHCNGLVVRRSQLDAVIDGKDPEMAEVIQQHVEQIARDWSQSIHDRIGDIVLSLLPTGNCTADRVAAHFGVNRRTLSRQLSAKGHSFKGVLDEKRRELVTALIASGQPFTSVVEMGGFASSSSFSQWFLRRYGTSPRQYRANLGRTL